MTAEDKGVVVGLAIVGLLLVGFGAWACMKFRDCRELGESVVFCLAYATGDHSTRLMGKP